MPTRSLAAFLKQTHLRLDAAIANEEFEASQRELLTATIQRYRSRVGGNSLGDQAALFYLVAHPWKPELDAQAEHLAAFYLFYLVALDLLDDVQDDDLTRTPFENVGAAIALNTALTLLALALAELGEATALEPDAERRLAYSRLLTRVMLLAGSGQHRDLMGAAGARTPEEVLAMERAKCSSVSLVVECAALYAGCPPEIVEDYRQVGTHLAQLGQIVDGIRDILGKPLSPDLATGKRTFVLACFYEMATDDQIHELESLLGNLPAASPRVQSLLYDSGAVQEAATQVERLRVALHETLAGIGQASPEHRMLLQFADALAHPLYPPPAVACSRFILQPQGPWHDHVRAIAHDLAQRLAPWTPPAMPALVPWHLPQWMYAPSTKTIFYADLADQFDEMAAFFAELTGDPSPNRETVMAQAPVLLAHEFFHAWRHASGRLTSDTWAEERAANTLAIAYCRRFVPESLAATRALSERILARHEASISPQGWAILAGNGATGGEVSLREAAILQAAMVHRLCLEVMGWEGAIAEFLPAASRCTTTVSHGM